MLPAATVWLRDKGNCLASLEADGHDAREALALLPQFEDLLALHLADRDRLINEVRSAEA